MNYLGVLFVLMGLIEIIWVPRFVYTKYNNLWVFWYNRFWFDVKSRKFIKLN